ncbi:MAG: TonB-dependent receptor plug domain-containing protein, partial [Betaproteobacteria bacterium]|nr:TonB-dependent receptor plug domain-containing protein [Betaproteobacteria bacterium]
MGDAPAAATGSPQALERVTVTANGRGQTRQVQAISRDELQQLAPGASPLEAVSRLPSVNFQSADPFGAYEWSTRITVRGFNQNQLGFTLDDIPLGDMSYANFNGLHISRAISTENIARTLLSPGTGSLATASSSNLGGTLQFYSVDPAAKAGVEADQSFGSFNTRRTFIKAQTGMGRMGGAYISVADQRSNKWKGAGDQSQQQVNLKYVNEIGSDKLSAFVNTSRRREVDYQDL